MAEQDNIFGSTARIDGQGAVEAVQAEEIRRLEQQKQQAEAAAPMASDMASDMASETGEVRPAGWTSGTSQWTAPPEALPALSTAELMEESARAQAADQAQMEARRLRFEAEARGEQPASIPIASPAPAKSRTARVWDASAANARAASRPMATFATRQSGIGFSAPAHAGTSFDIAAYDAQRLVAAGGNPLALSPSAAEYGPPEAPEEPFTRPVFSPVDPFADLRSEYGPTAGTRDTNGVAARQSEVEAQTAAPPPSAPRRAPPPRYANAKEANDLDRLLRTGLEDDYTERGDYAKIKTPGFEDELNSQRVEAELIEAPKARATGMARLRENFTEDLKSPFGPLNYGFALQQVGQGAASAYEKTNSGDYVTPEQQSTATAGLLPGAFALAGTAIGSVIAPGVGSWVGGLAGGAVGSVAQGVIGANNERAQASREIGEQFTAALGEATGKLRNFSAEAEATGAPLKQLQQTLGTVASAAPLGAGAIAGAGAMTNALGEYAGANYASIAKQVQDPSFFAARLELGQTGRLTRAGYNALGTRAAIEGDAEGLQEDDLAAQRAPLADNERYQAAQKRLRTSTNSGNAAFNMVGVLFGVGGEAAVRLGYGAQAARQSKGFEENVGENPEAKEHAELFKAFGEVREAEAYDTAYTKDVTGLRTGTAIRGGSAADIAGASQPVHAALTAQTAGITKAEDALSAQLAKATDPSDRAYLTRKLEEQEGKRRDVENTQLSLAREDFLGGVSERQAGFGLSSTRDALSGASAAALSRDANAQAYYITGVARGSGPLNPTERAGLETDALKLRYNAQQNVFAEEGAEFNLSQAGASQNLLKGRLAGRTYDQLAGDEYGILSAESARANQLRRDAESPGITAQDRLRMQTEATGIETSVLTQRHDFQGKVYGERLEGLDLGVASTGQQVGEARAFGTPGQVFGAQSGELDALKAKFAELTAELARGGLTADEVRQKESQLVQVRGQAVSVTAQQRDEKIASARGEAEDALTTSTAPLRRQVALYGSASVNPEGIDKAFGSLLTADREAINAYAPGTRQRQDAEAKLATDQARSDEAQQGLGVYNASAAIKLGDVQGQGNLRRAETQFEMSQILPYQGGPQSDPLTAGAGLQRALRADIARTGRDQADEDSFRAQRQGQGKWDDIAELGYQQSKEKREEVTDVDTLRLTRVDKQRRDALLHAIPETVMGGGGIGNTVSTFSFDALSAAYSPNELQGSWGGPRRPSGASLPGSVPGNAVEAFQQHAAAAGGGERGLTAAIQTLGRGMNTNQLAALLQQINQTLQRMEGAGSRGQGQSGPPRSFGSTALQAQGQSFNPNRPSR